MEIINKQEENVFFDKYKQEENVKISLGTIS